MAGAGEKRERLPETIYHVAEAEAWNANGSQAYAPESLADEGFIHASSWAQLRGVIASLFAGRTDLVVLEIDSERLAEPPVWEDLYNLGQPYPHIYSSIPRKAVVSLMSVRWDSTGEPDISLTGTHDFATPDPTDAVDPGAHIAIRSSQRRHPSEAKKPPPGESLFRMRKDFGLEISGQEDQTPG